MSCFCTDGKFQFELIYLYFPPSFHQTIVVSVLYAFRCYNNIINRSCVCWSYFCLLAWVVNSWKLEFKSHQWFELQYQQPRPSKKQKFKILKTNNYNNQWFKLQLSTAQARRQVTSTPTRPVDNIVITTKDLHDRNIHILDGTTVKNR